MKRRSPTRLWLERWWSEPLVRQGVIWLLIPPVSIAVGYLAGLIPLEGGGPGDNSFFRIVFGNIAFWGVLGGFLSAFIAIPLGLLLILIGACLGCRQGKRQTPNPS